MNQKIKTSKPSLLGRESRGGDDAERGFKFQEKVLLSYIPAWLAQDGFTDVIREAMGDTEAKFFSPEYGRFIIDLIEVKSESLTPTKFWEEIGRFKEIDGGSPRTYRSFKLVCAGLSKELHPLVNGLRRLRSPGDFYEKDSGVQSTSLRDFIDIVKKHGEAQDTAHFLLNKVQIRDHSNTPDTYPEALFTQALTDNLPEYAELQMSTLKNSYQELAGLVAGRLNEPISRIEIEEVLRKGVSSTNLPAMRPISIHTSIGIDDETRSGVLHFDWENFFGGENRAFPRPEEWRKLLMQPLRDTQKWVIEHRNVRRIKLTGNRRLSASLAIGSVFSAVAGFTIDMAYRGEIWSTDDHPIAETKVIPFTHQSPSGDGQELIVDGQELIVSVSVLRDIGDEVENSLCSHGLEQMPKLHIKGEEAIVSAREANAFVRLVKDLIAKTLRETNAKKIHLFFAGPAFLALFLGHRLNATAPFQCYEWVSSGNYVPTCCLFGR